MLVILGGWVGHIYDALNNFRIGDENVIMLVVGRGKKEEQIRCGLYILKVLRKCRKCRFCPPNVLVIVN